MSKSIYTNSLYATNAHEFSGLSSTQSTGGWESLSAKRTTSFTDIHQEVFNTVSFSYKAYNPAEIPNAPLFSEQSSGPRLAPGPNGGGDPGIGEDIPGSPVGDMLIPMLLIALGYGIVKLFRNRKTSQAL